MSSSLSQGDINKPERDFIIVIGRQFGSGGRSIGRIISQKLDIAYYDSELLSATAERLGFSREIFAAHDEKKPSPLKTLLQGAFGIADNFHETGICGERIYRAQIEVIREICKKGSCVIVGRTADYILRDNPNLTSVFLSAPIEWRAKKILKRGEAATLPEAIEKARKFDKERESYYNFYTGGSNWGKAENYSLSINSSTLSEEDCADLIIEFARRKTTYKKR